MTIFAANLYIDCPDLPHTDSPMIHRLSEIIFKILIYAHLSVFASLDKSGIIIASIMTELEL